MKNPITLLKQAFTKHDYVPREEVMGPIVFTPPQFFEVKPVERGFEVLEEYKEYFEEGSVKIPARKTKKAAGCDIAAIGDYVIPPNSKAIIDTGLTSFMGDNEWLALFVRSGLAYDSNLTLQNATGVIDADFYGDHIRILLRNEGTETFRVNHGDRIAQGIFLPYLKPTNDDETEKDERKGGFGFTGVKSV